MRERDPISTSAEKTYVVEGMTCASCELAVRDGVEELARVQSAQADRTTGRLLVRGDVDDAAVREAVAAAGYRLAA